jgi:hypothetical protein
MSTIVINPNDMIIVSDSIAVKAGKVIELIQPMATKAGTNCQDVQIAKHICDSIVELAAIAVIGFLLWKLMNYIAKGISEVRKRDWAVNDREEKAKAESLSRSWQLEDQARKKKDDLMEKKLAILKECCYTVSENEVKNAGSPEVKNYLEAINEALGKE